MNSPFSVFNSPVHLDQSAALDSASGSRLRSREKLWVMSLSALLALAFSTYYLKHTFVMNEADPRLLAQFRGNRPYQLRILMPLLAYLGARFTPLDAVRCYQLLVMAFSVAFFRVFSVYLQQFCAPRAAGWLSLILAWPLFAFYSHKWFYPYDVPAAFFATLGLLFMVQRRWALYLIVFFLATLNRETSAFLTLAFTLTLRDALPKRHFAALLASQIAIWVALRGFLSWIFASNGGSPIEWHLADNWNELAGLFHYPSALAGYPAPLALVCAFATLVVLWVTGVATRRVQPEFLRRARGVFWPFLAAMSGVGMLTETRLYSELIPILLAPALIGVYNLISPPSP
ncbi:hypothetical protein B1R32_10722 [Abditibacterium utsteinense]|uniref:Glycosyltransferase RgtA/B/C/D-like domain-containing protein n=1 Tax=Abditibacterium utsteinense TaxID=1960156 RepID=A0A2S8ST74_9BACT|nr:hypothetical protein [Abditibacterium utsteinense]PQV63997.1 hypothetical protein B1R32_10722 [Abditibacterium utsteinense]